MTQSQTQLQPDLFDLYRAGLRTASEMMQASLESAERLQNQQLVAIRNALEAQSRSLGELGRAKNLDELLALQTRMAGAQLEGAIGMWASLWQMAGENHMMALRRMQTGINQSPKQESRKAA